MSVRRSPLLQVSFFFLTVAGASSRCRSFSSSCSVSGDIRGGVLCFVALFRKKQKKNSQPFLAKGYLHKGQRSRSIHACSGSCACVPHAFALRGKGIYLSVAMRWVFFESLPCLGTHVLPLPTSVMRCSYTTGSRNGTPENTKACQPRSWRGTCAETWSTTGGCGGPLGRRTPRYEDRTPRPPRGRVMCHGKWGRRGHSSGPPRARLARFRCVVAAMHSRKSYSTYSAELSGNPMPLEPWPTNEMSQVAERTRTLPYHGPFVCLKNGQSKVKGVRGWEIVAARVLFL